METPEHDVFFWNGISWFQGGWLLGSILSFRGGEVWVWVIAWQASRRGRENMDIQCLYARNVFFFNQHGMESMQSSQIQSVQNSTNMNIFWSGISNNKGQDSRMLLCCVFVCLWSNCCRSSGHWYRNIPAELAMHFPQAMEILEGDGSDASVSTITMSKEPWASSDDFFYRRKSGSPKKGRTFWG